jgi:hypothetical protein
MIFDQAKHDGEVRPVWVALGIAIFGLLAMLLVDHGPWARPHPQPAHIAYHRTTGEAAHAVGARVTPTPPKSPLEPELPMPKQAEPPSPEPGLVR